MLKAGLCCHVAAKSYLPTCHSSGIRRVDREKYLWNSRRPKVVPLGKETAHNI
jgi:hypothetical protein